MHAASGKYAKAVGNLVVAMVAAGLVAGCTAGGESASAGSGTTTGEPHVEWNPCSELPAEALEATGAKPETKHTSFDAPGDRAAVRMCAWDSADGRPYFIGVGAFIFTLDEFRQNDQVTGFTEVQINDRSALTFYPTGNENPIRRCYVGLPMAKGGLMIYADWRYSKRDSLPESPPCGLAVQHAHTLEPYLPE
ncbi:DUF3558 domain-containing protein [Nocardia flavorosea]|uniref:DUF3558 domain-containing protein n=1 Tax=Nocardia flavorosea TaxID=53429 RepID=UPI0024560C6A|nr:DUF3558 domain-containing protein [Nocardia flavorosea]